MMTMNYCRIFISFWLIIACGTPAAAISIQKGIHGIPWGSSISKYDYLTEVHKSKLATYYTNSHMVFQFLNQPVPGVVYGFYRSQFFAVFIKLHSPDQFYQLKKQYTHKYGNPKTTFNAETKQTVHRWKDADVKIKLKMKKSNGEIKLAVYNARLSAELNEEQVESIPPEAFSLTPTQKDETRQSAPLLDF
jgi:hypothetical protein